MYLFAPLHLFVRREFYFNAQVEEFDRNEIFAVTVFSLLNDAFYQTPCLQYTPGGCIIEHKRRVATTFSYAMRA